MSSRPSTPPPAAPPVAAVVRDATAWVLRAGAIATPATAAVLTVLIVVRYPALTNQTEALRSVRSMHTGMLDSETGLRAYLATGDQAFLAPFRAAEAARPGLDRELDDLPEEIIEVATEISRTRLARQRWLHLWAMPVLHGTVLTGRALQDTLLRGKALMDGYRQAEAALEITLVGLRDGSLHTIGQALGELAVGLVGINVGAGAIVLAQRRRLVRNIVEPLAGIAATVAGLHSEQVARYPALPPETPHELGDLARQIVDMSESVQSLRVATERREAELSAHVARQRRLLETVREISESLDAADVFEAIDRGSRQLTGFDRATLWLRPVSPRGLEFEAVATTADHRDPRALPPLVGRVGRYGKAATIDHGSGRAIDKPPAGLIGHIAVPLTVRGEIIGVLELEDDGRTIDAAGRVADLLEGLAIHAAAAVAAVRAHEASQSLALTDALTGAGNRRAMDADLDQEIERAARYHRPLSVIIFDLDHFKKINDRHGHGAGDDILRQAAAIVRSEIRHVDSLYRYGGEEFLVIARETAVERAAALAERMRQRLAEQLTTAQLTTPVTASFGVAGFDSRHLSGEALVGAADEALYVAKTGGRNQVRTADNATIASIHL